MNDQATVAKPDRHPDPGARPLIRGGSPKADYSYWAVSQLSKRPRPSLEQTRRPTS